MARDELRPNWTVAYEPQQNNKGRKNKGGLVVYLTDGTERIEVTRVGFARPDSRNPEVTFHEQLALETAKAEEACDVINAALDEADRARAEALDNAVQEAREKVREILGETITSLATAPA